MGLRNQAALGEEMGSPDSGRQEGSIPEAAQEEEEALMAAYHGRSRRNYKRDSKGRFAKTGGVRRTGPRDSHDIFGVGLRSRAASRAEDRRFDWNTRRAPDRPAIAAIDPRPSDRMTRYATVPVYELVSGYKRGPKTLAVRPKATVALRSGSGAVPLNRIRAVAPVVAPVMSGSRVSKAGIGVAVGVTAVAAGGAYAAKRARSRRKRNSAGRNS